MHPTFLYESLWNFIGLAILLVLFNHIKFPGYIFWCYTGWYGIGRFFIESLRTDSLMILGLRTSMWVGLICFVTAVVVIALKLRRLRAEKPSDYVPQFAGEIGDLKQAEDSPSPQEEHGEAAEEQSGEEGETDAGEDH